MRVRIDKSGRVVIPKGFRERLGLKAGDVLDVQVTSGGLSLAKVQESPRLVKDGNVLVFACGVLRNEGGDMVGGLRDSRMAELVRQAMQ